MPMDKKDYKKCMQGILKKSFNTIKFLKSTIFSIIMSRKFQVTLRVIVINMDGDFFIIQESLNSRLFSMDKKGEI